MSDSQENVGVIGATSLVGRPLISQLASCGFMVKAFTRGSVEQESCSGVEWLKLTTIESAGFPCPVDLSIPQWICVAPIWCLPSFFPLLEMYGVRRIVTLSSTSIFIKNSSTDSEEKKVAHMLAEGEKEFVAWAEKNNIEWLIVRPTLIYGSGKDKNVAEIARFIDKFSFFPIAGEADGLRQPIHADDVASACRLALMKDNLANRSYNISGGEKVTYREMVRRIFIAKSRAVYMPTVPLWMFRLAIFLLKRIPRYSHWTVSMVIRMNQDLVFDHSDAINDFSFNPRPFVLSEKDVLL
jgi:nucleoside-diphosphate-sugar epimerase